MYCPNCGSQNQADVKFCTRCGTNLAAVTQALAGKPGDEGRLDDWTVKLLKKYYAGRRDTVFGIGMVAGGLMIMGLLASVGMRPMASFWIVCWMFIWGVIALADGLAKWFASSGEMKLLSLPAMQNYLPRATQEQFVPPAAVQADPPSAKYTTGPTEFPGSVTEQTTRHLEEGDLKPPAQRQSKQTR
jgi:hypothetical protein